MCWMKVLGMQLTSETPACCGNPTQITLWKPHSQTSEATSIPKCYIITIEARMHAPEEDGQG